MKKINLILFSIVAILFVACTDDTNQYSNQLFTDGELNRAFRQSLTQSADSANTHLCIPNSEEFGYTHYLGGTYKIGLPANAIAIADTLTAHGSGYLIDSLLAKTNYSAELCGNGLKIYYNELLSSMVFADPYRILNGDSTALTTYFEKNNFTSFLGRSQTLLAVQFTAQGVTQAWNDVISKYYDITGEFVSIEFALHAAQAMTKSFIQEMKVEEILIRKNASHRGATSSKLYEVFATLD